MECMRNRKTVQLVIENRNTFRSKVQTASKIRQNEHAVDVHHGATFPTKNRKNTKLHRIANAKPRFYFCRKPRARQNRKPNNHQIRKTEFIL